MGAPLKNAGLVGLGLIAGVAVSLQFSALAYKTVASSMPPEELRVLADVYGLIKSDYVEAVDDKQLLGEAIAGMVGSLDPHSAYLDRKAYAELREGTEGRFVGLGIEIAPGSGGAILIVAPIEDSPAWRAGIQPGDLITRIDDVSVQGIGIDDAIKKMRGAAHTSVTLTIARRNVRAPLRIVVAREHIVQQSVKGKIVEPGYAWLRVSQFQEPTVDDMAARLAALYKQEPHLKGLVLDLRDDPGGLLQGAIGVAAAFLPKGAEIVSTDGRPAGSKQRLYGRPEFYSLRGDSDALARLPAVFKSVPLVVLVNAGSASASEIVAGALQDTGRAAILGSRTFGKGSVQTIRPLSNDSAVKLTTARYYTPAGRSIQATGIVPDFPLDERADGDGANGVRTREADLARHLSNDLERNDLERTRQGASERRDDVEDDLRAAAMERKRTRLEYGSADDFQLRQALRHLKGLPLQLSRQAGTAALAHEGATASAR